MALNLIGKCGVSGWIVGDLVEIFVREICRNANYAAVLVE